MSDLLPVARAILERFFGYPDFRRGQVDVVAAVLSGRDTLGVLPTGGGKSLCYQVPALMLPGLTIVISPLVSLMKDQVDRLVARGVPATLLNSTLASDEVAARLSLVTRGQFKLLYVAPERFEAADLRRAVRGVAVSLLAVDEAHCISDWGHDFRPSFRRIAHVSQAMGRPQVIALTATATPRVRQDIVAQLRMRDPRVIVGGFDRRNLHYAVRSCPGDNHKTAAVIAALRAHAQPAIVYASTRSSVERVAGNLSRAGVRALPYHAGLDDAHRHEVQDAFMAGRVATIVATNAFGMGIDKPDVRLVVHQAMPGTLEAYYQEAGRAGRDGLGSHCVLLHADNDRSTHEWFIRGMYPPRTLVERVYARLVATHVRGLVTPGRDSGTESAIRLLVVHGALAERPGSASAVLVRLLATPARITRELAGSAAPELALLRSLWRRYGVSLEAGARVDLTALPGSSCARTARESLERLRGRQFVDFSMMGAGVYLTRPTAPLEHFEIDWAAIERRRMNDLAKLRAMEGYARTTGCRRDFVLRYFGERRSSARCDGCDNCLTSGI